VGLKKVFLSASFLLLATCVESGNFQSVKPDSNEYRIEQLELGYKELNVRVDQTEAQLAAFISSSITNMTNLETLLNTTVAQYSQVEAQLAVQQVQINQALTILATLQAQEQVVSYVDPCGNSPVGYDEVLLRTSTGRLIAYFETGGSRFLSFLEPGNYRTTDTSRCYFTVDADLNVVNQHL